MVVKKSVLFKLNSPGAQKVAIVGDFNNWDTERHLLKKDKAGVWSIRLRLAAGWHEYRFMVDGVWQDDPYCLNFISNNVGGRNCVIVVE
ncbi:MAG: isoamylase early set domain-containing protein [Candidatus Omnitrophota bacterium]